MKIGGCSAGIRDKCKARRLSQPSQGTGACAAQHSRENRQGSRAYAFHSVYVHMQDTRFLFGAESQKKIKNPELSGRCAKLKRPLFFFF